MARIYSIFLTVLITTLSLASFTMTLTPAVYAAADPNAVDPENALE